MKEQEEWVSGVLVLLCACEEKAAGSVLAGPRRRRGGDHAVALGGVALQGRLQRAAKGGGGGAARCVGASTMQNVAG